MPAEVSIGRVNSGAAWSMPLHCHDSRNESIVIVQGRLQVRMRGQTLLAGPGDVLFYPLGEPHEEQARDGRNIETIFLNWSDTRVSTSQWPLKVSDVHGRLNYLAHWMWDSSHFAGPTRRSLLAALLTAFAAEYETLSQKSEDDIELRIRRFVQSRLNQPLRLDALASHVGLSRFHFVRLFRRRVGQTPMHFVRSLRVQAAKTLLFTTPLSQRAIAAQVGLGDEFRLSRTFMEVLGQRPSQLRRPQARAT